MYFEIYDWDNLIKRGHGADILGDIDWDNELMNVPSMNLTLPVEYIQYLKGREEFKLFVNDKCFWGIVKDIDIDKAQEVVNIRVDHVVSEWEYRQISVNHAVTDNRVDIVFKGSQTTKSKSNDEGITANDFTIRKRDVSSITDSKLIKKAMAQAWQLSTGDKVAVTKVDKSKIEKKDGTYNVTFSTAKGTSVTVKCEVKGLVEVGGKYSKSNKTDRETITAHKLTIDESVVPLLTNDYLIKVSKAEAHVYRHPKQNIPITSVTHNIQQQDGKYDLTFSTGNTSLTVKVTVENLKSYTPNISDPSVVDKLSDIFDDKNFAYPGWRLDWQDGGDRTIDYVYSRQNKLEALTKTIELTDDLFWRVGFTNEKVIEIGKFGEQKNHIISLKRPGRTNSQILKEPTVDYDFENVINVATVYSEKSDTGMSSMTLREVYMDQDLVKRGLIDEPIQQDGFPVVILRANVNNERNYTEYATQYPMLAPNNELEYAVLDEESIALEAGYLIEGTYAFTDLAPTNTESKKVTDKKRIDAAKTAYNAAIRKLKQSRRTYKVTMECTELPADINVGDKVRFIYDNNIWHLEACSNYWKKVLSYDDWFYVEKISYHIYGDESEVDEITLSKYIKVDRESDNQ